MNTNTMPLEAETRVLIDRSLENLGWKLSGKDQNVYYEQPRTEAEKKKLGGKRPDYVLYSKESDRPLIVIEAKKKGSRIDVALEQGINYARAINAPLVFARLFLQQMACSARLSTRMQIAHPFSTVKK